LIDFGRDLDEDLLCQILGVSVLPTTAPGDPVDDGPVNLDKLFPRMSIGCIVNAKEQTVSCFRKLVHERLPTSYTRSIFQVLSGNVRQMRRAGQIPRFDDELVDAHLR
jgi:hypothetical protein